MQKDHSQTISSNNLRHIPFYLRLIYQIQCLIDHTRVIFFSERAVINSR